MVAPFLFADVRGGATPCTVYRYVGASPAQVGDTYGTRFSVGSTGSTSLYHCAKWFQGNLYGFSTDGIYKKDDPTVNAGPWTQVVTFATPETAEARTSGLHVVHINDVPYLVCVRGYTGNSSWGWAKFDGTTWTQDAGATVSAGMTSVHVVAVYRNVIHMLGSTSGSWTAMTFDPSSESFGTVSIGGALVGNSLGAEACILNDRLFLLNLTGAPRTVRIGEFSGGVWVNVSGSEAAYAAEAHTYTQHRMGFFSDGTFLYGLVPATDDGWKCLRWDSTIGAPTDISTSVLPTSLLGATDGGSYSGGIEFGKFVACLDQESGPTTADIWLFQSAVLAAGAPFTLWKWNGSGTVMGTPPGTAVDVGGDHFHAVPNGLTAGGEHIWSAGKLDAWATGKSSVPGAQRTRFRCSGAAGVANKKVKLYHDGDNEPPIALATLIGVGVISGSPAGAPSLGTNEVLNVDADPTVEYYADWNIFADGFVSGDRAQLKPVVSV